MPRSLTIRERLLGCALALAVLGAAHAAEPVRLHRITLGDIGGWIELPASADGRASRWLLDTGASRNLVSPAFAARHALVPGRRVELHTAGGTLRGSVVMLPALRIGDFERADLPAVVLDPARLVGDIGREVDGVLGLPFLEGLALTLDLRDWTARFAPSGHDCPAGLEPWPLQRHAGLPAIRTARGDGSPDQVWLLDTGNPAALVQLIDEPATPPALPLPGSGWLSLVPRLAIGPAVRTQVPVVQLPAPELRRALGAPVEGLAGTALFDGARLHLDLARDLACLEPGDAQVPGGFGLALERRDGRLVVGLLMAGSPAQEAGLQEGEAVHRWADAEPTAALPSLWARVQGQSSFTLSVGDPPRSLTLRRAHFAPAARADLRGDRR